MTKGSSVEARVWQAAGTLGAAVSTEDEAGGTATRDQVAAGDAVGQGSLLPVTTAGEALGAREAGTDDRPGPGVAPARTSAPATTATVAQMVAARRSRWDIEVTLPDHRETWRQRVTRP